MGVLETLLKWTAPFLDPMQVFYTYANEMNGVHSNSLQSFRELIYHLDPSQALRQNTIISGEFANVINNSALDFTQTELQLTDIALEINKLAQVTEEFAQCVGRIMEVVEIASAKLEGDEALTEITADVDIAAVAEGGFNPIADVLGLILTVVDGALLISTIKDLAEEIYQDIKDLTDDLNSLKNVIYPATAPQPYNTTIQPGWKTYPKQVISNDLTNPKGTGLLDLYGNYFNANPQQQATFQTVMKELLEMGLTKDQIIRIMGALLASGSNPADILLFLQGILNSDGAYPNSPTLDQIVQQILSLSRGTEKQANLKQLVALYAQVANISGASRLLERLMTASFGPSYNGYFYELKWCVDHKDQIARIEDVTLINGDVKQAADVVMKSRPFTKGAIVDTKSYKVSSLSAQMNDLLEQIRKDARDYPGYPIVLVFDSSKLLDKEGHLLPGVQAYFEKLAAAQKTSDGKIIPGATIMTSPPDKVWNVGEEPLPSAHTNPMRLIQSARNVATEVIEAGQSQLQLPPGQTEPPQQLPPQQLPPQK